MNLSDELLPIMTRLQPLQEKGYVLCGLRVEGGELVVLMIHKSWQTYNLHRQFTMAWEDVPHDLQKNGITLEIPTLEMFEDKYADEPHDFMIVFDGRVKH